MRPTLSIITATSGRPTLARTLAALAPQLEHGDELHVIRRDDTPWGNATRDQAIKTCGGSHLWWMDDDDLPTPDAVATIRHHVSTDPDTIHIFRMTYEDGTGLTLWDHQHFAVYRLGGTMCVVPNIRGTTARWQHTETYGQSKPGECGDWHFLKHTAQLLDRDPVWHDTVIARIRVPA